MSDLYLVTGGAGFIGSNIVELLLSKGRRVRILDNFSTGRRRNIEQFAAAAEVREGDIRDPAAVKRAVDGCRFVLHQAALPSVARSVKDPALTHEVNVTGTLNVLIAARDAGAERFVFASSSSVYGESQVLPKREDMLPAPLSPYAVSKLAGEHYAAVFDRLYGLSCIALRYFNVFGPRQDPSSQYAAVIPNFFKALCFGEAPVVDGDGNQSRDFTFVANVAEANLRACETRGGGPVNIACGKGTTVNDLLRLIQGVLGVAIAARHGAPRAGDVRHSLADISRAKEILGFTPAIGLEEGVRLAAGYYRQEFGAGTRR